MRRKNLFGTNGIRGIVNQDLTPDFATKIGMAIGNCFDGGNLFVGYDCRTSSSMLASAVTAGLCSVGCKISELGYAPTPAIQFAVRLFEKDGAVIITASHNPPQYNGMKVVDKDGIEISRTKEIKIENIFFEERFKLRKWNDLGKVMKHPGILNAYKEAVKSHVDIHKIRQSSFKVVVDPANSVGALVTPYLLRELGCKVVTINSQIDGTFPGRMPEPKPETLGNLSAMVRAVKADFGVAHDGDADRSIFVDETGEVHWGDKIGAIIVDHVLQKHSGATIVTPVSSSRLIETVVKAGGGQIVWTKVGSIVVSRTMIEVNSILGLEENGGIFYSPHQPVRDGAMATALLLEILANKCMSLSQLVGELPQYYLVKQGVNCPNEIKQLVLEKLLKETECFNRVTIDGVKIFFKDAAVLIRPSGTESSYRVFAEAKNINVAKKIAEWGTRLVRKNIKAI